QGFTVHPRPDEWHIRYQYVYDLKQEMQTEFNIKGNSREPKFVDLIIANRPTQLTLVTDAQGSITSNYGWNTIEHKDYLVEMVKRFQGEGIRVSIFVDPVEDMVEAAAETGTDRIELYTEAYAASFGFNKEDAISPYIKAAQKAREV